MPISPRSRLPSGFDLTAIRTRAGDRSVRNDDRYLFLEALLSAREKLLLFYVGRSVSDNSLLPPSVVVGELLDGLEEGFYESEGEIAARGRRLRDLVTTEHPLQPFSPLYFEAEVPGRFSYSGEYLAGARALTGPRREPPVLLREALTFPEGDVQAVRLADLIRFFRMPTEYLLKYRLGVDFREKIEEMEDREPISLDALDRFGAGEFILAEKLQGASSEELYPVLKGMGHLPLGTPGRCAFDDLDHEAGLLADDIQAALGEEDMLPPVSAEVMPAGFRVSGVVDRLTRSGRMVHTFGQLTEGRKIELWITHLFMNIVTGLPCPASSMMIGRGGKGARRCRFDALPHASELFQNLLEIYRLGLTIPLPLFPKASCAYARAFMAAGEKAPERKAMTTILRNFLSTSREHPGEFQHPAVRRLFGTRNPLLDEGEAGFAALSIRVFGPMLQAEGDGRETPGKGGAP